MDGPTVDQRSPDPTDRIVSDLESERVGWYELAALVRTLHPHERLEPGYYADPSWSVRDVVGHLGTWLAEAEVQLEQLRVGTYEGHDIDIDALNASMLAALHDQPWDVVWTQANAARTKLLQAWYGLTDTNDEAAWWIRKAGPDHYHEHLSRLREWVAVLVERRADRVDP